MKKDKCPVCGKQEKVEHQDDFIRYCHACKFQWSTELPLGLLIAMAVEHVRQG